jgi:trigger factor
VDFSAEEKAQGLVGRKPLYKVWVRGLREKKMPELNDAFAKSFQKETVDELKQAVRRDVASYKRSEAHQKMKEEIYDKLIEMHSFLVPEGLLEKQAERLLKQVPDANKSEEMKKEARAKAERQVRLYFILQKIYEKEDIELDEVAIESRLEQLAEESQRPMDEVRRMFEEDLRESMREEKTMDFLLANAKLEEDKKGDKK